MTKDEMKKVVCQAIDEATEKIHETVLRIESEPELGYKETKTAAKAKTAKHAIRQAIIFFMEILLTNTMEIKMQAPGLIGELDTEGDQRGGNREKRNGGKGKNSGKKMGDGNGSSIVRRDRDRRTDGKRPEAQIDLFADRAGIAAMAVVMGQFFCNEKEG